MFKFRKNKSTPVTIRAEELLPGQRFVYDEVATEVLEINRKHPGITIVRLGPDHPKSLVRTRQIALYNELLIDVTR